MIIGIQTPDEYITVTFLDRKEWDEMRQWIMERYITSVKPGGGYNQEVTDEGDYNRRDT